MVEVLATCRRVLLRFVRYMQLPDVVQIRMLVSDYHMSPGSNASTGLVWQVSL